jgi:hypothetical protein
MKTFTEVELKTIIGALRFYPSNMTTEDELVISAAIEELRIRKAN